MSIIDSIKSLFIEEYKAGNRIIIYYDEEGRLLISDMEFVDDQKKNKEILRKLGIQKIIKKLYLKDLSKVISKFKATPKFLLHFFEIMEQQEERISDTVNFNLSQIFERLQTQDVDYFEFYRYIYTELSAGKKIGEIIRDIKGFEGYIEFFEMLDTLKEEDKAKLFGKLKEKILKEEDVKKKVIAPIKQPVIMTIIIMMMFVWFSDSMIKDIMSSFVYIGYPDKIPGTVSIIYTIGHTISANLIYILFITFGFIILIMGLLKLKSVKSYVDSLVFGIDFYKYFNEMYMGYMIFLQASNNNKQLKDMFYDLRESYKDNIYYYFIFDMIFKNVEMAAEKYIPLRKYGYILSTEFITNLEQIIKQNKFILIQGYLRFVDGKLKQLINSFSSKLSLLGMVIVAGGILMLFLGIFTGNNSKSDLMNMQASGSVFEADVKFNLLDDNKKVENLDY